MNDSWIDLLFQLSIESATEDGANVLSIAQVLHNASLNGVLFPRDVLYRVSADMNGKI